MSGANIDSIMSRSSGSPDPGAHGQPGDRAVHAELGAGDVGGGLAEDLLADPDERAYGEHVGHRPGRCEERVLLAEQLGDPLLERRTVGSSPYTSSPTSAEAIAARMASVGRVTVSLRRSITGATLCTGASRTSDGSTSHA